MPSCSAWLLFLATRSPSRRDSGLAHASLSVRRAPRTPRATRPDRLDTATARHRCATGPPTLSKTLVAVLDDDAAAVDAMTALFTTWGAQVIGRREPQAMLAACGECERYPDFIVADLCLADGASGIDAVRALRDALGFCLPALIVSGDTSMAAERAAHAAGLTLLAKPVDAIVLEAVATALVVRAMPRAA